MKVDFVWTIWPTPRKLLENKGKSGPDKLILSGPRLDRLAHFRFNHAPFLALAMSASASGVRPTLMYHRSRLFFIKQPLVLPMNGLQTAR